MNERKADREECLSQTWLRKWEKLEERLGKTAHFKM